MKERERKSLSDVVGPSSPVKSPLSLSVSSVSHTLSLSGCNYACVNKRDQRETSGIPVGPVGAVELTQPHRMTQMSIEDLYSKWIFFFHYILSSCPSGYSHCELFLQVFYYLSVCIQLYTLTVSFM